MAGTRGEEQQPSQETLTRNRDELLQEIRVTQTGVQVLTGLLLTVPFSNRFAVVGLAMLALTVSGVVLLVVDVVVGSTAGWLAGGALLLVLTVLWAVVPRAADRVDDSPRNPPPLARPLTTSGDPPTWGRPFRGPPGG